ncbi:MAG TPA: hypothetical protein VGI37_14460 [Streptosporangiaceae bacterium]
MTRRPERAGRPRQAGDGQASPPAGHGWRAASIVLVLVLALPRRIPDRSR